MKKLDFSKMKHDELVRVRLNDLTRTDLDIYFREVSNRRRIMKAKLQEYDNVMRELNVKLSRV